MLKKIAPSQSQWNFLSNEYTFQYEKNIFDAQTVSASKHTRRDDGRIFRNHQNGVFQLTLKICQKYKNVNFHLFY